MNMRLLGARSIRDVVPEMVDVSNIHMHIIPVPKDNLYDTNCACWFTSLASFSMISILQMNPFGEPGSGS